jgi:toxin CcdB
MARFTVYDNSSDKNKSTPYLVDVQTDLLEGLSTRVVIPLRDAKQYKQVKLPQDLLPQFTIKGNKFILETPSMAAVPCSLLKKQVCSLKDQQNLIITAIDRLFHGF